MGGLGPDRRRHGKHPHQGASPFSGELFNQLDECFAAIKDNSAERSWIVAVREICKGDVPEMTVKMRKRLEIVLRMAVKLGRFSHTRDLLFSPASLPAKEVACCASPSARALYSTPRGYQ